MSLIAFIILGAIVGWIASRLMGRDEGIFMSIIIGIVGSIIGGYVSRAFTGGDNSYLAFSWMGLFWSLVGAVILVALMNAFSGRRHHNAI
jgi:uncharacterized membrane protein YeaQ/YmgE (transglycosylase-associated protein family)